MDSKCHVELDRDKRDPSHLVSPYHYLVAKKVGEQSHSYDAGESAGSGYSGFPNVAQGLGCELLAHAWLKLEVLLSY